MFDVNSSSGDFNSTYFSVSAVKRMTIMNKKMYTYLKGVRGASIGWYTDAGYTLGTLLYICMLFSHKWLHSWFGTLVIILANLIL